MPNWIHILKKDLISCWLLATVSLCIGLFLNQFRDKPLPLVYESKETRLQNSIARLATSEEKRVQPESQRFPLEMNLEEFSRFVEEKRGLVLDARAEIFYRLGHVPGAVSLPRENFEERYIILKPLLESHRQDLIAIYCSNNSCEDSFLVQKALVNLGYNHVGLFKGGWSLWKSAGKPQEEEQK